MGLDYPVLWGLSISFLNNHVHFQRVRWKIQFALQGRKPDTETFLARKNLYKIMIKTYGLNMITP